MELINAYINGDYKSTFNNIKSIWIQHGIIETPDIASIIENLGISRHMYKEKFLSVSSYEIANEKEFYKMCLGFILYLIDQQLFSSINSVFDYEEVIIKEYFK